MSARIDYYLSLNSPWTYLGHDRLAAAARDAGAVVVVHPVDFSVVFPATGGLPLPKRSPQRQAYRLQELQRWPAHLGLPINVVTAPTVREDDGLAMSSRNAYLSEEERRRAPSLFRTLSDVRAELQSGNRDFVALEQQAGKALVATGFATEYVAIRRAVDLGEPDTTSRELVVLAAARLGQARLIDNLVVTI